MDYLVRDASFSPIQDLDERIAELREVLPVDNQGRLEHQIDACDAHMSELSAELMVNLR
jgi:hypothetical protein